MLLAVKVVKAPVDVVVAPIDILLIVPSVAGLMVTTPVPVGERTSLALAGERVTAAEAVRVVNAPDAGVTAPTVALLTVPPLMVPVLIVGLVRILLVSVSAVARPTKVSVAAGKVRVPDAMPVARNVVVPLVAPAMVKPPEPMAGVVSVALLIMGLVSVLLVRVCDPARLTRVSVEFGTVMTAEPALAVKLLPLTAMVLPLAVSTFLFDRVCVAAKPTSVSVTAGRLITDEPSAPVTACRVTVPEVALAKATDPTTLPGVPRVGVAVKTAGELARTMPVAPVMLTTPAALTATGAVPVMAPPPDEVTQEGQEIVPVVVMGPPIMGLVVARLETLPPLRPQVPPAS